VSNARHSRQNTTGTAAWAGPLALVLLPILFVVFQQAPLVSYPKKPDGTSYLRWEMLMGWLVPDDLVQQWFGPEGSWALADRIPLLVTAAVMALATTAIGRLMLRAVGLPSRETTPVERWSLAWIVGAQAVSLYVFAVGLCGGLHQRWLFLLPGAAAMVGWLLLEGLPAWRRPEEKSQLKEKPAPASDLSAILREAEPFSPRWLWLALPFVLVLVMGGMLPPLDFDVREYHLQVPKEWYTAGQIDFLPHNVYGNMPLGAEMQALLGMCLMGDWWHGALAGKLTLALYPLATAAGLYGAAVRWYSRSAGVVAVLVYLSIPWVVRVSTAGLIDAAVGANLFFAFYAVARARDAAQNPSDEASVRRWLIVAGWIAGAAVSCKYPAVLWVVIPLAGWIAWFRAGSERWASLGIFLAIVAVSCGPWLAKNLLLTGNPTYPLLYELFGGRTRTPELNAQWVAAHSPHGFSLGDLGQSIGQVCLWSEWQSPLLLLIFSARGLVRRRVPHSLAMFLYIGFYLTAWWLLTHRIDRFWVPVLPLAALLVGMRMAQSSDRWTDYAFRGFLILSLASNWIFVTLPGVGNDCRYLAPLAELRNDPLRVKKWHLRLNEEFAKRPDMKVLSIGDAMVFDLEMPILYATTFDPSPWEAIYFAGQEPRDSRAVLAMLHEQRITHVYVDWGEIARYRSPGNYGFAEFITPASFARLVKEGSLKPPLRIEDRPAEVYVVPTRAK